MTQRVVQEKLWGKFAEKFAVGNIAAKIGGKAHINPSAPKRFNVTRQDFWLSATKGGPKELRSGRTKEAEKVKVPSVFKQPGECVALSCVCPFWELNESNQVWK